MTEELLTACDPITADVRAFYRSLPFNVEQSVRDTCRTIREHNQIRQAYPPLDALLRKHPGGRVLDVGCGAGWFVNTVAHHYGMRVTGVDLCEPALARAIDVASELGLGERVTYLTADLFRLERTVLGQRARFDVVNSLGVLHHTADCRLALSSIAPRVASGGTLHLGLYHRYGRKPFLELFEPYRRRLAAASDEAARRAIEDDALALYRELNPGLTDQTMLRSWCRDQALHPHETQHTLQEVCAWLAECGLRPVATSLNRFEPVERWEALFEQEPSLAELSYQRNHRQRRYYPGFFIVMATR